MRGKLGAGWGWVADTKSALVCIGAWTGALGLGWGAVLGRCQPRTSAGGGGSGLTPALSAGGWPESGLKRGGGGELKGRGF